MVSREWAGAIEAAISKANKTHFFMHRHYSNGTRADTTL
jgi:hypothetical protein